MARIMRDAKMHQKSFPLKKYKTWKAAEADALEWINEQKEILPPSRMNEEGRMTKRNRSGVVGVFIARSVRKKPNGRKYEHWKWIARWPDCPFRSGLTWTINEETPDDDAFALAYLSRDMRCADREKVREKLAKIYGSDEHTAIMNNKMINLV